MTRVNSSGGARRATAPLLALMAASLLVACDADPGDTALTSGSPDPASTAGPEPDATEAPETSADDRFCEITQEGLVLTANALATIESTFASLPEAASGGDLSPLRSAGTTILDFAAQSKVLYAEAITYVDDSPEVVDGFEAMGRFIDLYSIPVGELMAGATTFEQLGTDLAEVATSAEVQAILESAPAQQATVEAYTEARCDIEID